MTQLLADEMVGQRDRLQDCIHVGPAELTDAGWLLHVEHQDADGIFDMFRIRNLEQVDDALARFCGGRDAMPEGLHFHQFPVKA